MIFIQIFKEYLRAKLQAPVIWRSGKVMEFYFLFSVGTLSMYFQVSSKHKPSSVVGSVKRKFVDEEEEEEEEYDPLNPAVGTVASVIRGPARK